MSHNLAQCQFFKYKRKLSGGGGVDGCEGERWMGVEGEGWMGVESEGWMGVKGGGGKCGEW